MKKYILFILFFVLANDLSSENNTFILIDVSGNPLASAQGNTVSRTDRKQALDLLNSVLIQDLDTNKYESWNFNNPDGILKDALNKKGNSYLKANDILGIIPYGEKETYKSFRLFSSKYPDIKIKKALSFARQLRYNDQLTFGKLARAKSADIAIDAGINSYYLIEISGLGGDHTGSKGLSDKEKELVDQYNGLIISEPLGVIVHKNSPLRLVIKKIDLKKVNSGKQGTGSKGIIKSKNVTKYNFRIISPNGSENNPQEIKKDEPLIVSWNVLGAPEKTKYTIVAKDQNSNNRIVKTCIDCYRMRLKAEPGLYRISVRGSGLPECRNNNVFVKVKNPGGGAGFLIFVLVLIAIGLLIVYIRKKDPFGWWKTEEERKEEENESDNLDINI